MVFPSEISRRKVLLTGMSGFTGSYVAAELNAAGYEVCDLVMADHAGSTPVDLLDARAVETAVQAINPHAVIHLAAIAFAAHGDADSLYRTNIVGTRHLLAALNNLPVKPARVVLASSAHVYGNATGRNEPLDEAAELAPVSDYAVSKLAMEFMARTWADRLPIEVTRPFNYTGVGQSDRFLIPKIVDHFRRGEPQIELGNLDVWREFMDVRSVAWAYRRLLETTGSDTVFNLCTGKSYSLREVLAMMHTIAGYDIDVRVNPAFVRDNEVRRLEGCASLLERRIGPLPRYELADTLRWMFNQQP